MVGLRRVYFQFQMRPTCTKRSVKPEVLTQATKLFPVTFSFNSPYQFASAGESEGEKR